jgi:hypothetical protein
MIDERTASPTLKQILVLAQHLTPAEKVQFMQQILAELSTSLAQPAPQQVTVDENGETWGQRVARQLELMDYSEWNAPEFDDPVEWLRRQREEDARARNLNWGSDE